MLHAAGLHVGVALPRAARSRSRRSPARSPCRRAEQQRDCRARPAAEFRDSIGVQTHFPFTGYAYDAAPTSQLAEMLRTVGIRHLRDDTCFNTEPACQRVRSRIAALRDAFGPERPEGRPARALQPRARRRARTRRPRCDIERALTAATSTPLADMVAGLEPVNEPDLKDSATGPPRRSPTTPPSRDSSPSRDSPACAACRTSAGDRPRQEHARAARERLDARPRRHRQLPPLPPAAWGGPEHASTPPAAPPMRSGAQATRSIGPPRSPPNPATPPRATHSARTG